VGGVRPAARLITKSTLLALDETVRIAWNMLEEDEEVFVHPRMHTG
jgi:hypothetical protein